ncbi:TolB-like translocation protein [Candidatus Enterovibrio altilux]|uniref:TolB n=2 Tax=Enterovibrio TaxID=188143 RepID=UPI001237C200|nr:TolB [Candidatus Enterovibrio luxaltus]
MILKKFKWILLSTMGLMMYFGMYTPTILAEEPVALNKGGHQWLMQQSQHFIVHFRSDWVQFAAHSLDIAEKVHQDLASQFSQMPTDKTHLILEDDEDSNNGNAMPIPSPHIHLSLHPPRNILNSEGNEKRLDSLIRHEYTHIVHMEFNDRAVTRARDIFGRQLLFFPHFLTPDFLREGLAIYIEKQGYYDSFFAMQMRMEVVSGQLADLSQVANQVVVDNSLLPAGIAYLYGAYFIDYLTKTYGEEAFQHFLTDYSGYLIPGFFLNRSARHAFGKDFFALWEEFRADLITQFSDQIAQSKEHSSGAQSLDSQPFSYLLANGESDQLLAWRNNYVDGGHLAMWDSEKNQWHYLSTINGLTSLDTHPQQGIVVSQKNQNQEEQKFNDLYRYVDGQWQSLTEQQRFTQVRWSLDGQSVFATRHKHGLPELWNVTLDGQQTRLWQGSFGWIIGDMALSPTGEIYASIQQPFSAWNIMRFEQKEQSWLAVTETSATEHQLSFIKEGELLFSADYNGHYQIYRMDLTSLQVEQLTNEVGGAFSPQWIASQGLIYQAYEHDGYHLRHIHAVTALNDVSLSSYATVNEASSAPISTTEKSEITEDSQLPTLTGQDWTSAWQSDDNQSLVIFGISGSDNLERHQYGIQAAWDTKNTLGSYQLDYAYEDLWQAILSREHEFNLNPLTNKEDRIVRQDNLTLKSDYSLHGIDDDLTFGVGTYWQKVSLIKSPQGTSSAQASDEWLAGTALQWDDKLGHYADLVWEQNVGGNYSGQKWQAQWMAHWNLPGSFSLSTHLAAGYADSKAKPFKLGGYEGDQIKLYGRHQLALSGYSYGAQVGQAYTTQSITLSHLIYRVNRNWDVWPIGFGAISGSVFINSGSSWNDNQRYQALTGVGAEVQIETIGFYFYQLPVIIGYNHGLDSQLGKDQVYIKLSAQF